MCFLSRAATTPFLDDPPEGLTLSASLSLAPPHTVGPGHITIHSLQCDHMQKLMSHRWEKWPTHKGNCDIVLTASSERLIQQMSQNMENKPCLVTK